MSEVWVLLFELWPHGLAVQQIGCEGGLGLLSLQLNNKQKKSVNILLFLHHNISIPFFQVIIRIFFFLGVNRQIAEYITAQEGRGCYEWVWPGA